jgi:hypothetical protein
MVLFRSQPLRHRRRKMKLPGNRQSTVAKPHLAVEGVFDLERGFWER